MDAVSRELLPGETVIWSGTPIRPPFVSRYDVPATLFGLLWLSFALFWWSAVLIRIRFGAPPFFILFGTAFVGFGVFNLYRVSIGRYFQLASTQYAVTSQRVIAVSTRPTRSVRTAYLWQLPPPLVAESTDRRGSIVFGDSSQSRRSASRWSSRRRGTGIPDPYPELEYLADAREVRDLLAAAQQRATGRAGSAP